MSELTLNPLLVAKSYDSNQDGKISDNLQLDGRTRDILGGDSVDALASALGSDRVTVRNGRVEELRMPARIPNLFGEERNVHQIAADALSQTSSWDLLPTRPNANDYRDYEGNVDRSRYQTALNDYMRQMRAFADRAATDRAVLTTALSNVAIISSDPEIRRVALGAVNSLLWRDITGLLIGEDDRDAREAYGKYSRDRELLRSALGTVKTLTDIPDVGAAVARANREVQEAASAVDTEKRVVSAKLGDNLQKAADKKDQIQNGGGFFKNYRSKKQDKLMEKAEEVGRQVPQHEVQAADLARKAYELGVSALPGYTKEGARAIARDSDGVASNADKLEGLAKDGTRTVEKLGK